MLGGTPGYRPLVSTAPPGSVDGLDAWFAQELLNPARALFNQRAILLREDPRILDKAAYNSILQAVAAGNRTTKAIGAAVGRDHNTLRHALGVRESAGFLLRACEVRDRGGQAGPMHHLGIEGHHRAASLPRSGASRQARAAQGDGTCRVSAGGTTSRCVTPCRP
ncbi:hypothetical protein [Cellulomonas soli]|uniref:Uncharacterized protein n=1 Tax=Cellulomonas soli TaxID=931535 RepID=A0A512PCX9_9CELL|nr:hypothetical protein [Cellulomonas soli]NYI58636.1 hypothetical protein [Cellulomonas soli]GEP69061.1 hypothetical protein CSO01_17760 [Cellulomonas soli]